jgi:hypothetical protein
MKKLLSRKSGWKHPLGMALCCIVPILLILGLSLSGKLGGWGYYLIFLLCPLMHIFMMPHHGHGNHDNNTDAKAGDSQCH